MLHKTKGIILKNTNYRDSSTITHIYTEKFGVQHFIINGVRSQKGAIRPSHIMPLNLVELVIYKKPNGGIQQIKELRCSPILKSIHFHMIKNGIAMFITELLNACLQEEEAQEDLFQFLENFIIVLDYEDAKLANYPSYFMMQLSGYLGFQPKGNFEVHQAFNLSEGRFISEDYAHPYCLDKEHSHWWWKMQHTNLTDWVNTAIPKSVRNSLLNQLLLYYELHGLHGRKIKSHEVLKLVLN
ncbi:MAG: DNA repair protein RecO (recombination protein O) [Bacteroidia bacterium]|jgi:DNA repair protein RecO (recombination protein O)